MNSSLTHSTTKEIRNYWWDSFSKDLYSSYGSSFKTQREIELNSLEDTLAYYKSEENSRGLCEILYNHWQAPPLIHDTSLFLERIQIPKIVLSNIDRNDIEAAISHHGLAFEYVLTSEDVKSYKPRPEMFLEALAAVNLQPQDVLHVGDSLTSDVAGAQSAGIQAVWINRKNKKLPTDCSPDYVIKSLEELLPILS